MAGFQAGAGDLGPAKKNSCHFSEITLTTLSRFGPAFPADEDNIRRNSCYEISELYLVF